MLCRKQYARVVALVLILGALAAPAFSTQATKQLAPGVTLFQDINTDPSAALIVNEVTVDLNNPSVSFKVALGEDLIYATDSVKGRETVSSITARKNAILGANGDFFPTFTGDPGGVCIVDGHFVSEPFPRRVALALPESGPAFFDNPSFEAVLTLPGGVSRRIDGIDRMRETNELIAYSPDFGASTHGKYKGTEVVLSTSDLPVQLGKTINMKVVEVRPDATTTPIPQDGIVLSSGGPAAWFLKENLKPGDCVSMRFDLKSASTYDWSHVRQAVGGGPWLVKDGNVFVDGVQEDFKHDVVVGRAPRTAVGLTSDNKLMIVTVDGRQNISRGISLPDLGTLMKQLGALNAINLDGGGSTTLACKDVVLNAPSGGAERPVADALLVFADQPTSETLPKLRINGAGDQIASGEPAQLFLTWGDQSQVLTEDQLQHVIWGTTNGIGFVNQKGYFTPVRLRKGCIKAIYCGQSTGVEVKVVAGKPADLKVLLIPDKQNPLRAEIKVTLADANDNSIASEEVSLAVTGGTADVAVGTTDATGVFSTNVTWDPVAPVRKVVATAAGLTAEAK